MEISEKYKFRFLRIRYISLRSEEVLAEKSFIFISVCKNNLNQKMRVLPERYTPKAQVRGTLRRESNGLFSSSRSEGFCKIPKRRREVEPNFDF